MEDRLMIAIKASIEAGEEIMKIYESDEFNVERKGDDSPLTSADIASNTVINKYLLPTEIPIISEENKQLDFDQRKKWEACWIVDPLDGTKEFIKRNGEFTVNIALIEDSLPRFGVIYVPAQKIIYYTDGNKAWKQEGVTNSGAFLHSQSKEIGPNKLEGKIRLVGSRSHMNKDTEDYISDLKQKYSDVIEVVSKGSSLKFCLVAEGKADVYPRYAPTMEWDTAAGQAICRAVGLTVIDRETGEEMKYNRENLLNNHFLVSALA